MRVVVLAAETSVDEAVAATSGADAVVVVAGEGGGGPGSPAGAVAAAVAATGCRVATFAGAPEDHALSEMVAELFGPDAETVRLET